MSDCCENLFEGFKFENLIEADPPERKGVYSVRIRSRSSESPMNIIGQVGRLVSGLQWKSVEDYVMNRIQRLKKIGPCPVIYIGSAGTQSGSKNTLMHRHKELANRHTAMYPIWALLYFDWKLDYGWKISANPAFDEEQIKNRYRKLHQGKNPALVEK